jgi:hypothetical protein
MASMGHWATTPASSSLGKAKAIAEFNITDPSQQRRLIAQLDRG